MCVRAWYVNGSLAGRRPNSLWGSPWRQSLPSCWFPCFSAFSLVGFLVCLFISLLMSRVSSLLKSIASKLTRQLGPRLVLHQWGPEHRQLCYHHSVTHRHHALRFEEISPWLLPRCSIGHLLEAGRRGEEAECILALQVLAWVYLYVFAVAWDSFYVFSTRSSGRQVQKERDSLSLQPPLATIDFCTKCYEDIKEAGRQLKPPPKRLKWSSHEYTIINPLSPLSRSKWNRSTGS